MLLALETSTNVCSVAFKDREGSIFEKRTEQRGTHSEQLFLYIEELMEEHQFSISDLQAILVSAGPGSYTGLRISASAVKGLLFQSDILLFSVNTLAGFAQSVVDQSLEAETVHAVIDARRVHLYHQEFLISDEGLTAESEVEILPIQDVQAMMEPEDAVIGTGIGRLEQTSLEDFLLFGPEHITARSLISLYHSEQRDFVKQVDPESYDPEYYTSRQAEK